MKSKALLATLLVATTLFVGCGSKEEAATGFTGEKVAESVNDKGDTTMATVEFENGKAVSVNIDVKLADGSIKSEASANGTYDMKNAPSKKWHEQVDLLEEAIVSNEFDLTKITYTNDKGNTDAVSGVSIKVKEYVDLVQSALDQAKAE